MRIMRLLVIGGILSVLAIVAGTLVGAPDTAIAQTPDCSPGQYQIFSPGDGDEVNGLEEVKLAVLATGNIPQSVKILANMQIIGNAQPEPSNLQLWKMDWNSASVVNGPQELRARIVQQNSQICLSPPLTVDVQNNTGSGSGNFDILLELMPEDWRGPTNVNRVFSAKLLKLDGTGEIDVSNNTTFQWSLSPGSPGSLSANGDQAIFSSGPSIGSGQVEVTALFGGQAEFAEIQIEVDDQSQSNYPTPDVHDDDESESIDDPEVVKDGTSDDSDSASAAERQREGDTETFNCISGVLSSDFGETRLTFAEFRKIQACLAASRFVVPTNIAPVQPESVAELTQDRAVQINPPSNTDSLINEERKALLLSGEADPDTTVLIYVFSEPLVLTTSTDGNGKWEYTLEDPLAPGDHEAFVVVEKDGLPVRSDGIAFAVAEVDASEDNPNGLSLALVETPGRAAAGNFVLAASVVVFVALLFITRVVWRKFRTSDNTTVQAKNEMQVTAESTPDSAVSQDETKQ